jgi:ATP synthase H subunit
LEKQLAEAYMKREQMIQDARQEAVKLLHEGEFAADKQMSERIDQARNALGNEKERIIQEKSKDVDKIKASAEQNFDQVVQKILEIFERSVNAEIPTNE